LRPSCAPIYFRRGDRPYERSGTREDRLLGFTPVCGPCLRFTFDRGPILPWALPLAGLAGAMLRNRVVSTPHRIISLRNSPAALPRRCKIPIRSWALGDPSRARTRDLRAARDSRILPTEHAVSVPPALQRIEGLMPGRSCRITRSDWIGSLSEVLHRP
jgi:hypothetical protein